MAGGAVDPLDGPEIATETVENENGVEPQDPGRGGAAAEATSAAAPATPAWLSDPDAAKLAATKKWESPDEMARAYQNLEQLLGKQGAELGKEREQWQAERNQLMEMMREIKDTTQRPEPAGQVSPEPGVDWELFDNVAGDTFGSAFGTYSEKVLPMLVQRELEKALNPLIEQIKPIQEFTGKMTADQEVQAAIREIAQENPQAWELTSDGVGEMLSAWAQQGETITPAHVEIAQARVIRQLMAEAVAAGTVGVPDATEGSAATPGVSAVAPASPPPPAPNADELRPLSSQSPVFATAPQDVNEEMRRMIKESVPEIRDGL